MKIDVFWMWFAAIMLVMLFQNFFTVKKSDWDVSYTYTTEAMDYIAYGQQSLTCDGDDLPWSAVRGFLENDIKTASNSDDDVQVVVLAVHKKECNRYWQPFWVTLKRLVG